MRHLKKFLLATAGLVTAAIIAAGQFDNPDRRPLPAPPGNGPEGFLGPGPGRFMPGGPGGRMGQERKLVDKFDQDGDKRLNSTERQAAREFLQKELSEGRGPRGFGGRRGGPGGNQEPPKPGAKVAPSDVKSIPDAALYEPLVLRTIFLEFESPDWEKELMVFNNTDVEVPARLTVDAKAYSDVGVHIRGMSSSMVGEGRKHSLNLALDYVHEKQNFRGYRTLNLLNSHEDPSFLRSVLYAEIARDYIPAPKANFVRLVINGENWGIYVNAQQFNKDFIKDFFGTTKGARWKAPGSPGGQASLAYLGEELDAYKRAYSIKSKDDPKAWADLIKLCKALNTTPADKLEETLAPLLDIDGALKFLALEIALINNDGYWLRSSDYCLHQDEKGKFHIIPHDLNEAFARPGGPGFGGRGGMGRRGFPGGSGAPRDFLIGPDAGRGPAGATPVEGVKLDPLYAVNDLSKPLISKLLAVPDLQERYLGYVRDIANRWLDWNKLGPIAEKYHALIADEVRADTRKLDSTEAFQQSLTKDSEAGGLGPMGGGKMGLKNFADQRRAYLLNMK